MSRTMQPDAFAATFGDVVSSYTRTQAIADGVLVDVKALARDAGFRHPVAMTAGAPETAQLAAVFGESLPQLGPLVASGTLASAEPWQGEDRSGGR